MFHINLSYHGLPQACIPVRDDFNEAKWEPLPEFSPVKADRITGGGANCSITLTVLHKEVKLVIYQFPPWVMFDIRSESAGADFLTIDRIEVVAHRESRDLPGPEPAREGG
jgi:hypothetical protein